MATVFIDPLLPWLAIQNQNHSYGRRSRPGSAQRFVRIWQQPNTACSRNSFTVPTFYKGSYDPSLNGLDKKIRLNPLTGRPRSAVSSASRRRLVPAVVGFEEDTSLSQSGPEEVWQKGFEQAHSKRSEDNGSDTSYVNFVRSYHGSSRSSTSTNKPHQAWTDSPKEQKRQKTNVPNVKVPYQSPSSTRRSSKDDQYEISALVLPRGEHRDSKSSEPEQTIIKPATTLENGADAIISPVTPPDVKPDQMEPAVVEVAMVALIERSTQTGTHGSVTMERSYERRADDIERGIDSCDKGIQTYPPRLSKPPSSGDFFQKENREDALKSKVQSQQNKLNRKHRKTSATIEITQPKFKEIPDFNMANWVQSRILVSAQSARYELPMDMHVLSKLSPLEYLTEYAIICKRRQALYKLIFSKYDRERKNFLKRSQAIAGLKEIHLGSASDHEISSILKLINLEENFKIDFRFFCSIAAFSERVLSRWMILPGGILTEKETIEKADFTNLTWKLEGVAITNHMQKVLYAL